MSLRFDRSFHKLPMSEQQEVKNNALILMNEIEEFNHDIDNADRYRSNIKQFYKTHGLNYTDEERDVLNKILVDVNPSIIFKYQDKFFTKTPTGEVMLPEHYIYVLESRILKSESNEELCTFLSFKDIVKISVLKIKRLFRGENNAKK